jgi:hypothetical protein
MSRCRPSRKTYGEAPGAEIARAGGSYGTSTVDGQVSATRCTVLTPMPSVRAILSLPRVATTPVAETAGAALLCRGASVATSRCHEDRENNTNSARPF